MNVLALHVAIPNLQVVRLFNPDAQQLKASKATFIARENSRALVLKRLLAHSTSTHETAVTQPYIPSTSTHAQRQLDKAARFRDIEACIHLLKHRNDGGEPLTLSSDHVRALISSAFHMCQPERAIQLVMSLSPINPKNFSILMRECLQRRDLTSLDLVLRAREQAGLPFDAYAASAKIAALGSIRQPSAALETLQKVWNIPECRTVEVCNAAIGACAISGDYSGAESAVGLLKASGLSADLVTFNSLIKAAGNAGLMNRVMSLFEELLREGLIPTHLTYTGLFSAAAKNACSDADWLFKIFNDMALAPNDYVLSSFFSAAAMAPCTGTQLDAVFSALAESRARGPLNDTVYTALLKLITRQGIPNRAVDVWRAAQQDEVALSPHLFSALFAACASGQSPALVDVAVDAYGELRDWWGAQDKHSIPFWIEKDVQWAYNSLINFIGADGNLDEALSVFESMKRDGPLPDVITFNTLIAAAGRSRDSQLAVNLFSEMSNAGVEPTERTYGALLHAFAAVGDAFGASSVMQSLVSAGIKPNTIMYTSFIDALVSSGDAKAVEQAFSMVDDMREAGLAPTAVTYGCLLNACDKLYDVERAFKVYQEACDQGIRPSDAMHDILIGVCTRSGRLDEALDLVKTMARTHSTMQQHTLDSLVRALSGTSPWRALRMMSLMQAKGMSPTHQTYLALITSCARFGDGADAVILYNTMRQQGMEIDGTAGSALITCLCQSHLDKALEIYNDMMLTAWQQSDDNNKNNKNTTNTNNHTNNNVSYIVVDEIIKINDTDVAERMIRHKRRNVRRGALPKRAHVPDAGALASLAQAFAARGELRQAWKFYKQLKRGSTGMEEACVAHRRMFEALIEESCRSGNIDKALSVFDDWKSASAKWFTTQSSRRENVVGSVGGGMNTTNDAKLGHLHSRAACSPVQAHTPPPPAQPPAAVGSKTKHPRLSTVSLAFLEACCRSEPGLEWRVYDVCSVMRTQRERRDQEKLARPQKLSHHVLGSIQSG